jgi:hypothetical protein
LYYKIFTIKIGCFISTTRMPFFHDSKLRQCNGLGNYYVQPYVKGVLKVDIGTNKDVARDE